MSIERDLELWLQMDQIISSIDPDWMYSDRTKEQQEKGRELENQLESIVKKLEEMGWAPRPYVEVKTKVMRSQQLTELEVDMLAKNPLSGYCDNWRKENAKKKQSE